MCDESTLKDWEKHLNSKGVTRRVFNTLTAGAALSAAFPPLAGAQDVSTSNVEVHTPDGVADCFMAHPASGKYPGVIVWPDILGLRPAFEDMAKRLAAAGYSVLVINPFYRTERAPVVGEGASFADPVVRQKVIGLAGTLNAGTHMSDATALVDYLDAHAAVSTDRKIGTMGFCMGGPMVMRTVATRPDRIGAGASFHGGGLVTPGEDSPHLLIPQMQADLLIAIADNDDQSDPEAKNTLRKSFDAAGVKAEVEVYTGAQHGWTVPDSAVYHEAQAEHAWTRLQALFSKALA